MRFTSPFILLITAISLIAAFLTVQPSLEHRQHQAGEAKEAYNQALFATEAQLVNLLRGVTENNGLSQNIGWGLEHSVSKALEAALSPGELDEVALMDANCGVVAKASIKESVIKNCPLIEIPVKKLEQFIWLKAGKFPTLGLVLPYTMQGKGELFLAGYVHLTPAWLALHPKFSRLKENLSLKIISEGKDDKSTVLMREGFDLKGRALAVLATGDALLSMMPRLMLQKPIMGFGFVWYNLFLALALAAFIWWQSNFMKAQTIKEKTTFLDALQNVLKEHDPNCPNLYDMDLKNLSDLCPTIHAGYDQYDDKIRLLKKESQGLREVIKEREFSLANKAQRIDDMAAYESLASQLKDSSRNFFNKITEVQSKSEDIADMLAQGLNRNAQTIHGFMEHWLKEIQERGSRRFFRALAETPGRTHETFLDEQIHSLFALSNDLATQSLNATMQAQKLTEGLKDAAKMSDHWRGLTEVKSTASEGHSLIDMVLEAQKLLRQKIEQNPPRFLNPFELSGVKHLPKSPKASFVSALYHIYKVIVATAKASGIEEYEIQNLWKMSDKRASFVVSLERFDKNHAAIKLDEEAQRDLDIAVRLLSIHNIHCQKLPGFDSNFVIAVSWEKTLPLSGERRQTLQP